MSKKYLLPTILGMNPPTKEVIIRKGDKSWGGYDLYIIHARFKDRTEPGPIGTNEEVERFGLATHLHFCSLKSMRAFAGIIEEAVRKMEEENDKS